jgi:taurine dioxygenase
VTSYRFPSRSLGAFGAEVHFDLRTPLDDTGRQALIDLLYDNSLLLFRQQTLSDADQTRVLGYFGNTLDEDGQREISAQGILGSCRLLFHADLAFTAEPFKLLSLYGLDVEQGSASTLFASGARVYQSLPASMRDRIRGLHATSWVPPNQTERAVTYNMPEFLPRFSRGIVIDHPYTGRPVVSVSEMHTGRIDELSADESDALLKELFRQIYAAENLYEHHWRNGDLVMWDNIALQHGRPDQTQAGPRRMRRIAVADKTFFELCPQFNIDDPRVRAWAAGERLQLD